MRICTINSPLAQAFRTLGHEVLALWPQGGGRLDLAGELDRRGFDPELVFQQETLDQRVVLSGLEAVECPRIFWAVDSHLNLPWHRLYGNLFDGIMSPHLALWRESGYDRRPVERLLPLGVARPFLPHAEREHDVGFVGRLSAHRMPRQWLWNFLKESYQAGLAQDLDREGMFGFYDRVRMAPNESIAMEVNFRLFEAASCGCLVLSQDIGEDQDVAFAPGREMLVYSHVLELKSLIDWHRSRPDKVETMGRAAWERIRRDHLPRHRAEAVIRFARNLSRSGSEGKEAERLMALACCELVRRGLLDMKEGELDRMLADQQGSPAVMAARIRRLMEGGLSPKEIQTAIELVMDVLSRNSHPGNLSLNLACSMAGLRADRFDLALAFLLRHKGRKSSGRFERPDEPFGLCLEWARELRRAGMAVQHGFPFDPGMHLPGSALDCLRLAETYRPGDMEPWRLGEAWFGRNKGNDVLRMGILSELWLRDRKNWRLGLEAAMVDLRCYRPLQGLEGLALSRMHAARAGEEERFLNRLERLDPGGTALAALGCLPGQGKAE